MILGLISESPGSHWDVTFRRSPARVHNIAYSGSKNENSDSFLVADTQLYKRLCPSVCRLVGWSVGRSVRGHESKSEEMSVLEHF